MTDAVVQNCVFKQTSECAFKQIAVVLKPVTDQCSTKPTAEHLLTLTAILHAYHANFEKTAMHMLHVLASVICGDRRELYRTLQAKVCC